MITSPYHLLLRPLLFSVLQADPEASHHFVMEQLKSIAQAGQSPWGKLLRSFNGVPILIVDDRTIPTIDTVVGKTS